MRGDRNFALRKWVDYRGKTGAPKTPSWVSSEGDAGVPYVFLLTRLFGEVEVAEKATFGGEFLNAGKKAL